MDIGEYLAKIAAVTNTAVESDWVKQILDLNNC